MRALWPELVPPARRHAIFALESAGLELTFILGPLLLVGALAALRRRASDWWPAPG